MFDIIVSRDQSNTIGLNGQLLVHLKKDLQRFKQITSENHNGNQNIIVMGYKTWESIGKKSLPGRKNIIITRNHRESFSGTDAFISIDNFVEWYQKHKKEYGKCFIIGGQTIYDQFMKNYSENIHTVYLTEVEGNHVTLKDEESRNVSKFTHTFEDYIRVQNSTHSDDALIYDGGLDEITHKQVTYHYRTYINKLYNNVEEYKYLNLLKQLLDATPKKGRNGLVYSKFGDIHMKFDLRNGFPLLTTKKMGWKTILRELLWFLSGNTDNKQLINKKVNIWTQNAEDYSKRSEYQEGDLGPIYGFQWRHFGADYKGCDKDYTNKGVDQIRWLIDEIKQNPHSRRLIISSWNPVDIPTMALPPCHVFVQFSIEDTFIDAQLYQRSGDMFLGVPYNIASYSYLLSIVGKLTEYKPRYLYHVIGDAHIYEQHVDAVNQQLQRIPTLFPKITINPMKDVDEIQESMFQIDDYNPLSSIYAPMIT